MAVSAVGILSETDTGATSHTTASFTPVAGRLYALAIHAKGTSPTPIPTISSSTGLNFVQVNTVDLNNRSLTVFRAMKASGLSSGTITISWASAVDNITIHLVELNGVDTSGADGAGAIVQSNTVSA